ncbi:MAG: ribosome small subunit-dependent GTPase A [Bacilli bacterium]|jgi:ribosome biogenesis GTPase
MEGKIIKLISNDYTVLSNNKKYICKSRGKFRKLKISPLVGDQVVFDDINNYILEVKKRKNELVRPPVANIDQAFIITSVKHPNFSTNLLDKLIDIIEFNNIEPIICFTKLDLLNKEEQNDIDVYINYYKKIGYKVFINTQISEIKEQFKNKISVFTGQTGAGKSTLLNNINPNLKIKTDDISYALGRGKHTTRHVELIELENGFVADTPGFSSLEFIDMKDIDIRDNFVEFELYKEKCKYRDCMHDKEDECEVKNKVRSGDILESRYQNYLNFIHKRER